MPALPSATALESAPVAPKEARGFVCSSIRCCISTNRSTSAGWEEVTNSASAPVAEEQQHAAGFVASPPGLHDQRSWRNSRLVGMTAGRRRRSEGSARCRAAKSGVRLSGMGHSRGVLRARGLSSPPTPIERIGLAAGETASVAGDPAGATRSSRLPRTRCEFCREPTAPPAERSPPQPAGPCPTPGTAPCGVATTDTADPAPPNVRRAEVVRCVHSWGVWPATRGGRPWGLPLPERCNIRSGTVPDGARRGRTKGAGQEPVDREVPAHHLRGTHPPSALGRTGPSTTRWPASSLRVRSPARGSASGQRPALPTRSTRHQRGAHGRPRRGSVTCRSSSPTPRARRRPPRPAWIRSSTSRNGTRPGTSSRTMTSSVPEIQACRPRGFAGADHSV